MRRIVPVFLWCVWLLASAAGSGVAQPARSTSPARTWEATMRAAAFHEPGAPDVIVHSPEGFDASAPLHLVVFLHGYRGCARVLMGEGPSACKSGGSPVRGWGLGARHDQAARNTLFVIPQLAFMRRSGRPGCFAAEGCFRAFVQELLSEVLSPRLGRPLGLAELGSITLAAHSAGFETALAILQRGGMSEHVRHVLLFDALYAGSGAFARWLAGQGAAPARLLSIHLGRGKTRSQSEALARFLRRRLGHGQVATLDERGAAATEPQLQPLADHRLLIVRGRGTHRQVPMRYLAAALRALPLPPRGPGAK